MTKPSNEIDNPATLLEDLKDLRNDKLMMGDFETAILLTHAYAWLFWISENYDEIMNHD